MTDNDQIKTIAAPEQFSQWKIGTRAMGKYCGQWQPVMFMWGISNRPYCNVGDGINDMCDAVSLPSNDELEQYW